MGRHHGDALDAFPVPAHSHLMTPAFLATHRAAIIALGLVAVWMQVSVIPAAAVDPTGRSGSDGLSAAGMVPVQSHRLRSTISSQLLAGGRAEGTGP